MESLDALLSPGADFDELFGMPSSRAPSAGTASRPIVLPSLSSMFESDAWLDESYALDSSIIGGGAGALHADSGAAMRGAADAGGARAGVAAAASAIGGGRAGAAGTRVAYSDGTSFLFSMPHPTLSEAKRVHMAIAGELNGDEEDGKDEDPGGSNVDEDEDEDDEEDSGAARGRRGSVSGGKKSREKQNRLERNRVSAKQSRLRKKQVRGRSSLLRA